MAAAVLPCKLSVQIPIKAGGGDLFHELLVNTPHDIISASPEKFHACEVHEGTVGTEGCVKFWDYTIDGEKHSAKTVVENVDMEQKTITYKWVEGDLLDLYKHLSVTIHVETKQGSDIVTWTIEYILREPDSPHPLPVLNFVVELIKELETHLQG